MPHYYDATTGQQVDAAIAAFPNGRPKPGYSEALADGEHARFSLLMRDSGRPTAFLTDAAAQQSIEAAWREYAAANGLNGAAPHDIAEAFKTFAIIHGKTVGAATLAAIAGVNLEQQQEAEVQDAIEINQRAMRKREVSDAWRRPPGSQKAPPPPKTTQITGDAEADFRAAHNARKIELANAWRGN